MTDWKKYPDEKPEVEGEYLIYVQAQEGWGTCSVREWAKGSWYGGFTSEPVTYFADLVEPPEIIEEPTNITQVERGKFYKEIHISENVSITGTNVIDQDFDWDGFFEKLQTYLDGRNKG